MFRLPTRRDIADTLVHLSGDRNGVSARDALLSILSNLQINGSGKEGFVKGTRTAACFTEVPFEVIPDVIKHRRGGNRPYGPFGIMVSKADAWEQGARPVLYLPDEEGNWIPQEERWRQVRFEPPTVDFTHEREWRSPDNFDLSQIFFRVIVPNTYHRDELLRELRQLPDFDAIYPHIQDFNFVYND